MQAKLEAAIDFPDEDLPQGLWDEARRTASSLAAEIGAFLADDRRGERLREGVSVAILGPPNAGKSSLMNALARREVAITAATAGTTRDVIEVALDLAGFPVLLADTAGLREGADAIEAEGVKRARDRASRADLKLVVVDATRPEEKGSVADLLDGDAILVANKIDLLPPLAAAPEGVAVSVKTGAGLEALLERLGEAVAARFAPSGAALVTRARHREALEDCRAALVRFGASRIAGACRRRSAFCRPRARPHYGPGRCRGHA